MFIYDYMPSKWSLRCEGTKIQTRRWFYNNILCILLCQMVFVPLFLLWWMHTQLWTSVRSKDAYKRTKKSGPTGFFPLAELTVASISRLLLHFSHNSMVYKSLWACIAPDDFNDLRELLIILRMLISPWFGLIKYCCTSIKWINFGTGTTSR